MKYRVYYAKYVIFNVEAENEDEAIDRADEQLNEYETRTGDRYYEYDDIEMCLDE